MPTPDPSPKGILPILRALLAVVPIVVAGTLVGTGVFRRPPAQTPYTAGITSNVTAAFGSAFDDGGGASHLSLTGVIGDGLRQEVTLSAATGTLDEIWASYDAAAIQEGWRALFDRPQRAEGGWRKTYVRDREMRIVQVGDPQGDARPVSVFQGTFAGETAK